MQECFVFGFGLFDEGWVFVSANNGHWAVFSTEGKLVNQYEPSAQGSGASFYASAVRNGYAWAGSNGYAPAYTLPEMEKASSLTLPMGTIFPDWEGEGFSDEMLVLVNCTGPLLDRFLQGFRRNKIPPVALKAVLTPTNRTWDSAALHAELLRERQAIQEGQAAHAGKEGT